MELDDILTHGDVIIDSNNSVLYERMGQLEDKPIEEESNCFGTVVHVLGVEDEILKYWQSVLRIPEVRNRKRSYDYIQYNNEWLPGYVGPLPMTLFLTESGGAREIGKKQAVDNVVSFFQEVADLDGFRRLIHAGINLGEYHGMEFMFHQNGCDGDFEVMPILDYVRNHYSESVFNAYVKGRNGIPIRFYEVEGKAA